MRIRELKVIEANPKLDKIFKEKLEGYVKSLKIEVFSETESKITYQVRYRKFNKLTNIHLITTDFVDVLKDFMLI